MAIKKDDVHKLIDQLNEHETLLAYQFLKRILEERETGLAEIIKESSMEKTCYNKSDSDKGIEDLLTEAISESEKAEIQPRNFQRTKDGKLLLDPNKKFDKDWYENDEAYDVF